MISMVVNQMFVSGDVNRDASLDPVGDMETAPLDTCLDKCTQQGFISYCIDDADLFFLLPTNYIIKLTTQGNAWLRVAEPNQ